MPWAQHILWSNEVVPLAISSILIERLGDVYVRVHTSASSSRRRRLLAADVKLNDSPRIFPPIIHTPTNPTHATPDLVSGCILISKRCTNQLQTQCELGASLRFCMWATCHGTVPNIATTNSLRAGVVAKKNYYRAGVILIA